MITDTAIEVSVATIRRRDDGIIFVRIKEDSFMDVDEIKEIHAAFREFSDNEPLYLLVEVGAGAITTSEAREYSACAKTLSHVVAEAIITRNTTHRLMARFFINFNKPKRKFGVFSRQEKAVSWLNEQMKQELPVY